MNLAEWNVSLLQCVTTDSEQKPDLSALHKQASVQLPTVCHTLSNRDTGVISQDGAEKTSNRPNLINCPNVLCDVSFCLIFNSKKGLLNKAAMSCRCAMV